MRLIVAQTPEDKAFVAWWVASRIPAMVGGGFGPCAAMAVLNQSGTIIAGIIFHEHLPQYRSISMSIAADSRKWLSRSIISGIMNYPFSQLQVGRITSVTAPRELATSVWQFLTRFPFQQEGRLRKGLGDADAIVWGFLETEWRTHRYNLKRAVEHRTKRHRRRRRGTLHLENRALH